MTLPKHQPCSSGDLSVLTSMDPARVSRAQARLLESGMIAVSQDGRDRRRLVVVLTERGRIEARRLATLARAAEEKLFSALDAAALRQFRTAMTALYNET